MDSAARVDELWDAYFPAPGPRPYMQTNRWLGSVIPTVGQQPKRQNFGSVEFDFLGHTIVWKHDGRDFPEPVLRSLEQLIEFSALEPNWDSHGGAALQAAAVEPALSLIFLSHQWCCYPGLVPLPDGGVGLRWKRGECELEVDIDAQGQHEAILTNIGTGDESVIGPTFAKAELQSLLDRFFPGQ